MAAERRLNVQEKHGNRVSIVEVIHDATDAKVILSDGSLLDGLTAVETDSEHSNITRVRLEAYVVPKKKENTVKIRNKHTGEIALLTKKEYDRFFDNRSPEDWVYA